tara:strand:- start:2937 stop:3251 length:315 start_codon:yes stop_codon:yes gene_type:complete
MYYKHLKEMKESSYQKRISDNLTKDGWFVTNLIKTNRNGIPDLLALKDGERPFYIECKTPKGKLSEIQKYMLNKLTDLNFRCSVSYGMEIKEWKNNSKKDTDLF